MDDVLKTPQLVSEEEIGKWYSRRVFKRLYELPDGTTFDFYGFGGTIPAIIFPLTDDNEVIAVRQFRYGANDFVLEIPGGNIKPGETSEQTATEELLEETGYQPEEIKPLGQPIWFDPASFDVSFFPVLALRCQKVRESRPEKTEVMETVLIPLEEWVKMVSRGEICDSKTLAVTLLALAFLGKI